MKNQGSWSELIEKLRLNADALWVQIMDALKDDFKTQVKRGSIDPREESEIDEWAQTVIADLNLFVGPVLACVTMLCAPMAARLSGVERFLKLERDLRPMDAIQELPKLLLYFSVRQVAEEVLQSDSRSFESL